MKSLWQILVVFVAFGALAACTGQAPQACPRASVPADVSTVTKFRDGPGRDLTDVVVEGEIVEIAATCRYDRRGVDVSLQVAIAGSRGPADRARAASLDYFVALVDPQQNVVAKEIFRVQIAFPDNQARSGLVDEIEPRIPIADPARASEYQILVGFQLTPEELDWNRRRRGG